MNILLYIPNISKEYGGVYQYTISLLRILVQDKVNNYYVYNPSINKDIETIIRNNSNFFILSSKKYFPNNYSKILYKGREIINKIFKHFSISLNLSNPTKLDKIIKKFNIHIVHCPYQHIPICKAFKITTMHDVQELYFPEFFSSEARAYRAVNYKYAIDNSNKIIVSFEHVKKDLIKFFTKSPDAIRVILLDMKNLWFDNFTESNIINDINIPNKYILYPATTWEHKNHLRLLESISYLKSKDNLIINLICTGNKTPHFNLIEEKIKELGLTNQVQFLGMVEDNVLFTLYKRSVGVVIPTLYEAGSFPLVESILMKIPVICSNVTSLPEMINNQEYIFDPFNIEDIAEKIKQLYTDTNFRIENIKNSELNMNKLRNNNCLEKILDLYNSYKI